MSKASKTKLPEGITLEKLKANWQQAESNYNTAFTRMKMLDGADRGRIWEALKNSFPKYQLLPDTNHVSRIKNALLAGIYSVGKSASLIPTTEEDRDVVVEINILLQHYWDVHNLGHKQMLAGERAALTNIGIIQVGWDTAANDLIYKVIDPSRFMRDPFADSMETAGYCIRYEALHADVLKGMKLYEDTIDDALKKSANNITSTPVEMRRDKPLEAGAKDYHRLIIHWVRYGNKVCEVHTLNNEVVLYAVEEVHPAEFPFAVLYCNPPAGDLIGTSECAKIFANSLAYNIMNSTLLTADYRNQRPPKFVSQTSGINLPAFVQHGNDADYTFVVHGDASQAVHYQQFPQPSPGAPAYMRGLSVDIEAISGVDPRYLGRDTGSILTTGGVEAMLNQATLIDEPKVAMYEEFTIQLTKLTMANLVKHAPSRRYFVKNPATGAYKTVEVDFTKFDKDTLKQYSVHISSELPKNKARLAQTANTLMEKQMQYASAGGGQPVDLITVEEWLSMQDLPNMELMQKRMGIQRNLKYTEQISRILFGITGMVENGVPIPDAIDMMANQLQSEQNPMSVPPEQVMEMPQQGQEDMPPLTNQPF